MNCAVHTDVPANAFCRTCGKALCGNCKKDVMGQIFCEPCLAARIQGNVVTGAPVRPVAVPVTAVPGAPSPGAALILGFIPGVGAMYNGQFMKALAHVVIFVLLIIAADNISGVFGVLIAFWVVYMAFEAYKTAEAKKLGLPLPDPLGIDRMLGLQGLGGTGVPSGTNVVAPAGSVPTAVGVPPVSTSDAYAAAPMMSGPGTSSMPSVQPQAPPAESAPTGAIVLIILGVFFLLSTSGFFSMRHFAPLLVIGLGIWIAYKRLAQKS
ncbi:MAG TPA: B-box zinc finger protein [Candidatus Limnocylindrales bacterium]|nr:B-box zinc finger protein [Candidatus Limnocylindrales bacterium]